MNDLLNENDIIYEKHTVSVEWLKRFYREIYKHKNLKKVVEIMGEMSDDELKAVQGHRSDFQVFGIYGENNE